MKYLCTGVLSLLLVGIVHAQHVQDIELVLSKQVEAWNNGDIDGYMQGYWKSDSLLFTSSGNVHRGWKETRDKYKKSYSSKSKMGTLKFSQLEINLLSSGSAWVFGSWELVRKKD